MKDGGEGAPFCLFDNGKISERPFGAKCLN